MSSALRIGVGDGGNDAYDWALLMPLRGNGGGDFSSSNVWAFGGEGRTNNGYSGIVTISSRVRHFDKCTAHTKCPPGTYTKTAGSATSEPKCETCPPGYFKASTSSISYAIDSCTAHTTCPPGKYTDVYGTATAQPKCSGIVREFIYHCANQISSSCLA